jgi:L,D-transpeptidase ErfK/SrfK
MLAVAMALLGLIEPAAPRAATVQDQSDRIVGSEFDYVVVPGDDLTSISARCGVPEAVLASANSIKPNRRIRRGQILHIDNRHIVPRVLSDGILINIPQRILFYFEHRSLVSYYPVSLGRLGWRTPVGKFTVTAKREHPTWVVPPSIEAEMAEKGEEVKTEVPPGPDNPLGDYALDLSLDTVRIHGTIAPLSIYAFRTHGCIRLHPEDIKDLYDRVALGAPGEIIYEPVMLAASRDGRIFVEANRDIYKRMPDALLTLHASAEIQNLSDKVDWSAAEEVLRRAEGIAREVGIHN